MYNWLIILYYSNYALSSQDQYCCSIEDATKSTEPRAVRLFTSIIDLLAVLKLVDSLQSLADAFHFL